MDYRKRQQQGKRRRVFTPREEEPVAAQPVREPQDISVPDEYEAGTYISRMARRYNGIPMPDGVIVPNGNEQWYFHTGAPPIKRASRGKEQPLLKRTDEVPVPAQQPRQRSRFHWLLFVGVGMIAMLLLWLILSLLVNWWTNHQLDEAYGRPRTFHIDQVVGHNDSSLHPSHFIAVNLSRHIVIVEIPGGDIAKSIIYGGGVLVGDGQDLTPVTLSFVDTRGTGRLDMLVHIADQTLVFLNNGTKFVPPSNLVTWGRDSSPTRGE